MTWVINQCFQLENVFVRAIGDDKDGDDIEKQPM
jgi:hypothetical protein